jgi:hypothetical protein
MDAAFQRRFYRTNIAACSGLDRRQHSHTRSSYRRRCFTRGGARARRGLHQLSPRAQPQPLVKSLGRSLSVPSIGEKPGANWSRRLGLDDTIERRWDAKIKARGIYRDPVRSSHGHFVKPSGLRWLSIMLLPEIPWAGCIWALPFLTVPAPSERYACKYRRRHKKPLTGVGRSCCRSRAGCRSGSSSW